MSNGNMDRQNPQKNCLTTILASPQMVESGMTGLFGFKLIWHPKMQGMQHIMSKQVSTQHMLVYSIC
jgi:hypothetical protein